MSGLIDDSIRLKGGLKYNQYQPRYLDEDDDFGSFRPTYYQKLIILDNVSKIQEIDADPSQKPKRNFNFYYEHIFNERINSIDDIDLACKYGSIKCLKYFILKGNPISEYCINCAIFGQNYEIIHLLLQMGLHIPKNAVKIQQKQRNVRGGKIDSNLFEWLVITNGCECTVLDAVVADSKVVVENLVENHIPIEDECLAEALINYYESGSDMYQILLDHNCNVNGKEYTFKVKGYNKGGRTPLSIALEHSDLKIAKIILDHGANPFEYDNNDFHTAVSKYYQLSSKILPMSDDFFEILITDALISNNIEMLQDVINIGYLPQKRMKGILSLTASKETQKKLSIYKVCYDFEYIFSQFNSQSNSVSKMIFLKDSWDKLTPENIDCILKKMIKENESKIVEYILENRDIGTKVRGGFSPLLYAARFGRHEIINYILSHNPDFSLPDKPYVLAKVFSPNIPRMVELGFSPCRKGHVPDIFYAVLLQRKDSLKGLMMHTNEATKGLINAITDTSHETEEYRGLRIDRILKDMFLKGYTPSAKEVSKVLNFLIDTFEDSEEWVDQLAGIRTDTDVRFDLETKRFVAEAMTDNEYLYHLQHGHIPALEGCYMIKKTLKLNNGLFPYEAGDIAKKETLRWMLEKGLDLNPTDRPTPAVYACRKGPRKLQNTKAARWYVRNGCDPRIEYNGESALSNAYASIANFGHGTKKVYKTIAVIRSALWSKPAKDC